MNNPTNSRFITYPDIVEKSTNHTVVLTDVNEHDIENVGLFCRVSNKNYDIYLCHSDDDAEWLASVATLADKIIADDASPLDYLQNFDDPSDQI